MAIKKLGRAVLKSDHIQLPDDPWGRTQPILNCLPEWGVLGKTSDPFFLSSNFVLEKLKQTNYAEILASKPRKPRGPKSHRPQKIETNIVPYRISTPKGFFSNFMKRGNPVDTKKREEQRKNEPERATKAYEEKRKAYLEEMIGLKEKKKEYRAKIKAFEQEFVLSVQKESMNFPVPLCLRGGWNSGIFYLFRENIYDCSGLDYSGEKLGLLIMDFEDKERVKFERLKHKFSLAKKEESEGRKREGVPEKVRIAVWCRDQGKCVKCGSREKLEYDHIIPHSKGGSDTVRNIELLCEKCNREKRDNII
jgi:hypothetical protein